MLLAVVPDQEEAEALRRAFAKAHCFVYLATYRNFVNSAKKYQPSVILLKLDKVTELLQKKMADIRAFLPDVTLVTISDCDTEVLRPEYTLTPRAHILSLVFQSYFYSPDSPNASTIRENLFVGGLLLCTLDKRAYLYGRRVFFSYEETYLLLYLSHIYPRRANTQELSSLCFRYGSRTARTTVASRISRINKKAKDVIGVPIITHEEDDGYGFSF